MMMTLGFVVLMSLLGSGNATSASAIVGCLNYQFMNNGSCHPFPTDCKACASRTNCTVCQKGFFGTVCEQKYDANCTGTCHKQYGHCAYGCPEGAYPADDNSCQPCPDHCLFWKRCRNLFCMRKKHADYRAMGIALTATELQDDSYQYKLF